MPNDMPQVDPDGIPELREAVEVEQQEWRTGRVGMFLHCASYVTQCYMPSMNHMECVCVCVSVGV